MRILLTFLLPLLLPTMIYAVWLYTTRPGQFVTPWPWRALPWSWLLIAGLGLMVLMFYSVGARFGGDVEGTYVPPQNIDGRVVPGHIVPPEPKR
jgi:hypothetical protein